MMVEKENEDERNERRRKGEEKSSNIFVLLLWCPCHRADWDLVVWLVGRSGVQKKRFHWIRWWHTTLHKQGTLIPTS